MHGVSCVVCLCEVEWVDGSQHAAVHIHPRFRCVFDGLLFLVSLPSGLKLPPTCLAQGVSFSGLLVLVPSQQRLPHVLQGFCIWAVVICLVICQG